MDTNQPTLPIDITDLIIDIIKDSNSNTYSGRSFQKLKVLSNLALVCHSFRNRTNKHRFSQLFITESATSRIKELHRLIHTKLWQRSQVIDVNIRTLFLIVGYISNKQDRHAMTVKQTPLLRILGRIGRNVKTKGQRVDISLTGATYDVPWDKLHPHLTSVIHLLCTASSDLASLRLVGFLGIPPSLLSRTNNVFLRYAQFSIADNTCNILSNKPNKKQGVIQTLLSPGALNHFEVLEIDLSSNFYNALPQQSPSSFPNMKSLTLMITFIGQVVYVPHILRNVPSLDFFQLKIEASSGPDSIYTNSTSWFNIYTVSIDLRSLQQLHTFGVSYWFPSIRSRLRRSAGDHIVDALRASVFPEHIRHLDLQMMFEMEGDASTDVASILKGHGCIVIADYLSRRSELMESLHSIKLTVKTMGRVYRSQGRKRDEESTDGKKKIFEVTAVKYLSTYFDEFADSFPHISLDIFFEDNRGRTSGIDEVCLEEQLCCF